MKGFLLKIGAVVSKILSAVSISEPDATMMDFQHLKREIKDGDCLVSRVPFWSSPLTNATMPGHWKHVAIYLDGWVYEAVTAGTRKITLEEFFFKKDQVGLCRYLSLSPAQVASGKKFLEAAVGHKYQWEFTITNDKKYFCSELAFLFLAGQWENFGKNFKPSRFLGLDVVRPTDIWNNLYKVGKWG